MGPLRKLLLTVFIGVLVLECVNSACLAPCTSCDGSTCKLCPSGFRVVDNTCVGCPQLGCLECSDTACTKCITGTFFDATAKKCMFCSPNCGSCNAESTCSTCLGGFVQDSSGKCIPGSGPLTSSTSISSEPKSNSGSSLLIGLLVGGGVILIIAGIVVW